MPGIKYIAAGFVQDAGMLLSEFVNENSPEFSVFTHFWKKHNFAAVFLGRSSSELQQFTHEIFQLSLKFLGTADLFHQIGSVYMLYALFRNQIVEPPTRIRVVLEQYQHFLELRKLAIKENYKALHYVIGYLLENAFDLVAHPTLVGPRNSKHSMEMEKKSLQMTCMLRDLKENSLSLFESHALEEIQEMNKAYSELIKNLPFKIDEFGGEDPQREDFNIERRMRRLANFIGGDGNNPEAHSKSEKERESIGRRRAQIKSSAFTSKAWFRQLNPTDDDDDEDKEKEIFTRSKAQRASLVRKSKLPMESTENEEDEEFDAKEVRIKKLKRHRLPKGLRRKGRPKKGLVLEELLMEDDDIQSSCFRKRGPTARSSYLDRYIEQPFNGATSEIAILSSTSEEEENVDEPEEVTILEDEENIDESDDMSLKEEEETEEIITIKDQDMDESEGIITF